MSRRDFHGEFEHIIVLALLRLENQAYGVTVRQEIEFRSTLLSGGFLLFSARLNI